MLGEVAIKASDTRTGDTRRVSIDGDTATLATLAAQLGATGRALKYVDGDGDVVTLATTADLRDALRALCERECGSGGEGRVLKVLVVDSVSDSVAPQFVSSPQPQQQPSPLDAAADAAMQITPQQQQQQQSLPDVVMGLWERRARIAKLVPEETLSALGALPAEAIVAALEADDILRPLISRVAEVVLQSAARLTEAAAAGPKSAWNGELVADVTLPPGTPSVPGKRRIKIWRILNAGMEDWPSGCKVVQVSGPDVAAPHSALSVPQAKVGAEVDIAAEIVGPAELGVHKSAWRVVDPSGLPMTDLLHLELNIVEPGSAMIGAASVLGSAAAFTASALASAFPGAAAAPVAVAAEAHPSAPPLAEPTAPAAAAAAAAVAPPPAAPPAARPAEPPKPKTKEDEMLDTLEEMGFPERELNRTLLRQYKTIEAFLDQAPKS